MTTSERRTIDIERRILDRVASDLGGGAMELLEIVAMTVRLTLDAELMSSSHPGIVARAEAYRLQLTRNELMASRMGARAMRAIR